MSAPEAELPPIVTHVAQAGFGEHHFHGYRVFAELSGRTSMFGLLALAISGRRFDEAACGVLDDAAACLTFADPRVWPLKAARLTASYGSSNAGIAAAALCSEGGLLGPQTLGRAMKMLADIAVSLGGGIDDPAAIEREAVRLLERDGRLPGFGVPARDADERLTAFRVCLIRRGRENGRFVRLAEGMITAVGRVRSLLPNISIMVAAACLDIGLRPEDGFPLGVVVLFHTILANAVEASRLQSPTLRRLPEESVRYEGAPPRESPRARASRA